MISINNDQISRRPLRNIVIGVIKFCLELCSQNLVVNLMVVIHSADFVAKHITIHRKDSSVIKVITRPIEKKHDNITKSIIKPTDKTFVMRPKRIEKHILMSIVPQHAAIVHARLMPLSMISPRRNGARCKLPMITAAPIAANVRKENSRETISRHSRTVEAIRSQTLFQPVDLVILRSIQDHRFAPFSHYSLYNTFSIITQQLYYRRTNR